MSMPQMPLMPETAGIFVLSLSAKPFLEILPAKPPQFAYPARRDFPNFRPVAQCPRGYMEPFRYLFHGHDVMIGHAP
jgi:hypothetical protein